MENDICLLLTGSFFMDLCFQVMQWVTIIPQIYFSATLEVAENCQPNLGHLNVLALTLASPSPESKLSPEQMNPGHTTFNPSVSIPGHGAGPKSHLS